MQTNTKSIRICLAAIGSMSIDLTTIKASPISMALKAMVAMGTTAP